MASTHNPNPGRRVVIRGCSIVSDTAGELAPPPDGQPVTPPPAPPPGPTRKRLPIGDYTEALLRSVGVTEERFAAAKKALGMAPTCNCAKRKAWLNRAGEWLASQVA